jgi:hypothetical protein
MRDEKFLRKLRPLGKDHGYAMRDVEIYEVCAQCSQDEVDGLRAIIDAQAEQIAELTRERDLARKLIFWEETLQDAYDRVAKENKHNGDCCVKYLDDLDAANEQIAALREALIKEEKMHEQTICERDDAQECLSNVYFMMTGRSPEWSNKFGYKECLEELTEVRQLFGDAAKRPNDDELLDRYQAVQESHARLAEALKPFSDVAALSGWDLLSAKTMLVHIYPSNEHAAGQYIESDAFRRARAVLAASEKEPGHEAE